MQARGVGAWRAWRAGMAQRGEQWVPERGEGILQVRSARSLWIILISTGEPRRERESKIHDARRKTQVGDRWAVEICCEVI
jgi:hypothetical protein